MLYRCIYIILFLFFSNNLFCYAQTNVSADVKKLLAIDSIKYQQIVNDKKTSTFINTKSKSFIANFNPLALLLKSTMFLYQNVLSVQISAECIYSPSCSNFSKQAIREFGIVKGVFLTSDRLLRCNPNSLNEQHFHIKEDGHLDDPAKNYRFRK